MRRALLSLGFLLLGWLGLLAWRARAAEVPLVITWAPAPVAPARDAVRGRWTWATAAQREAWQAAVAGARRWGATLHVDGRPGAFSLRREEVRGKRLLLAGVPTSAELPQLRVAVEKEPESLVVVSGCVAPEALTRAMAGLAHAWALLPACWAPGVPAQASVRGEGSLVAPRVDGRGRMGRLEVRWTETDAAQLSAQAVELAPAEAPAEAPTRLGAGDAQLAHDTLQLRNEGLPVALCRAMNAATGADLSVINTLALRGGLDGPVDPARLAAAVPFRNQVVLLTLDGEVLSHILEIGEAQSTQHLVALTAEGLAPDRGSLVGHTWRVATVDYLANGGRGNWTVFQAGQARVDTGLTLEDLALGLLRPELRAW
jgi:hypothetical protein